MLNNLYIFIEALRHNYEAGGVVMLPILLAGVVGFYFLYRCYIRIGGDVFRKDVPAITSGMRDNLAKRGFKDAIMTLKWESGIIAREMRYALEVAQNTPHEFQDYMQVRVLKTCRYMEQGLHIVSVMAAAAPLLGLLGTVTGMVSTFEVITLYGNQNPVLMADGISEALISTQSGLLIAFPLTLLKGSLYERIDMLKTQMILGATIIENYMETQKSENKGCENGI